MLTPVPPILGVGTTCDSAGRGSETTLGDDLRPSRFIFGPPTSRNRETRMAKRHLLILGLFLAGGALASACSDTTVGPIEEGDAGAGGEAGAKGNAGASANAGTTGSDAGSTGDAGSLGVGGDNGNDGEGGAGGQTDEPPFVFPAALNPQTVVVVGSTPASLTHLLVGAKDYATEGEIVSLTLATGALGDATTYADGDVVVASSAGLGFAIERTNDQVHLLDGGKIDKSFDLKDLGTNQAVTGTKAYVPFYNQSLIAVLDLTAGKISHRIDLNEYNAPGDSDHSAEITEGVYDPTSKVSYFLLQRIDINSYDLDVHLPCTDQPALIVGIDSKTDQVVDLNGSAKGKAIELELVNPRSLSINADGTALYLLADGCYEGATKVRRGVEVVDLTENGQTTVANQAAGSDYLASMILIGGANALLESNDSSYATHWNKLEIGGALGAEIKNVPQGVSFDGTDLIGVKITGKVGAVVRYKIATETSTVISPTSWAGDYSFGAFTALAK